MTNGELIERQEELINSFTDKQKKTLFETLEIERELTLKENT